MNMNITVIGAAGRPGQQAVQEASRRGHQFTGQARQPERRASPGVPTHLAAGGGRHRGAVAGADAVVITVPGGFGKAVTMVPRRRNPGVGAHGGGCDPVRATMGVSRYRTPQITLFGASQHEDH